MIRSLSPGVVCDTDVNRSLVSHDKDNTIWRFYSCACKQYISLSKFRFVFGVLLHRVAKDGERWIPRVRQGFMRLLWGYEVLYRPWCLAATCQQWSPEQVTELPVWHNMNIYQILEHVWVSVKWKCSFFWWPWPTSGNYRCRQRPFPVMYWLIDFHVSRRYDVKVALMRSSYPQW